MIDRTRWLILGLVLALGAALLTAALASTAAPADRAAAAPRSDDFANCRFGVGVARNSISVYPYTATRAGFYVNWLAADGAAPGLSFFATIRLRQVVSNGVYLPQYVISPTLDFAPGGLGPLVLANPGRLWLVGNEMDRPYYQDEMLPDMYAQAYHDAYTFIKGLDATARVGIGGVIQPTPVRLQYLDQILDAYRRKFGGRLPVDVWNTHLYILQETRLSWGAGIPPGIDLITGTLYTIPQSVDAVVFAGLIRDLRGWLKARGYQYTPLIVTEYGLLFPLDILESQGVTLAQMKQFLSNVIHYMNTAWDAELGDPADNYRLVQQAAIYSLDDDSTDDQGFYRWGSFLHQSSPPYTQTAIGAHYNNVLAALPAQVDLIAMHAQADPGALIVQPGETISTVVSVRIGNGGNTPFNAPVVVRFREVTGGQIGGTWEASLSPMGGCGQTREVSFTWPNLAIGAHTVQIEVNPDRHLEETNYQNNALTLTLVAGPHAFYLPAQAR